MCDIRIFDTNEITPPTDVHAFVDELLLSLTNSRIYSADHPRVKDSLAALASSLERHIDALDLDVLQIGAAAGYLFFDRHPLLSASQSAPRLLRILEAVGAGGLAFQRGAKPHEFYALARLIGKKDVESLDVLTANLELEKAGSRNVRFLAAYAEGGEEGNAEAPAGEAPVNDDSSTLEVPERICQDVFDHLTDVVTSVFRGHLFRLEDTKGYIERILKKLSSSAGPLLSASHYEHTSADQFQFRHSIRVACLALSFARGLTRDEQFLERIGTAALLHDVGKGCLDWTILHNPGRLDEDERREMERHAVLGGRLLLELEDSDPIAVAIAFGHHRTLSGGGYPHTRQAPDLSLATRLVKICDVYEALTARRPYKDPMSPTRSYRIMLDMNRESGGPHFDAALLHRFVLVNGIYPVGSWVRLDNGEVACVQQQSSSLEQPIVTVEKEEGQIHGETVLFAVTPRTVDLCRPDGDRKIEVVGWLGYKEPKAA